MGLFTKKIDLSEIELRLKRLENPPKYKVGNKVKWDFTHSCRGRVNGEGVVVKIRPIDKYKSGIGTWLFTDTYYDIWTGKETLTLGEHSL